MLSLFDMLSKKLVFWLLIRVLFTFVFSFPLEDFNIYHKAGLVAGELPQLLITLEKPSFLFHT